MLLATENIRADIVQFFSSKYLISEEFVCPLQLMDFDVLIKHTILNLKFQFDEVSEIFPQQMFFAKE